jgi:hypothetical protein
MTESDEDDIALGRVRYGTAHPEWVQNELWERAIREEWSAYGLRKHLGIGFAGGRAAFEHSAYRDERPGPYTGPFWSWERFGRTSTPLPDGRVIHIAGEHEAHGRPSTPVAGLIDGKGGLSLPCVCL